MESGDAWIMNVSLLKGSHWEGSFRTALGQETLARNASKTAA